MKRNIIRTFIAACVASAMFLACEPLEPSTYTETFYRVGTIKLTNSGRVTLVTDILNESLIFQNVVDSADLVKYKIERGQRVIATMTLEAIGSMNNNTITLNEIRIIPRSRVEASHPSDTMNHYYKFAVMQLNDVIYPSIWATGHLINFSPVYYIPKSDCKTEFHLYPITVRNDTLFMRLYSDIPDCDVSLDPDYTQSFLNYDLSSLRDAAANPAEQVRRDTILTRLDRLNKDEFTVYIMTPDTLRAKNSKNPNGPYLQTVPGLSVSTKVKLDF